MTNRSLGMPNRSRSYGSSVERSLLCALAAAVAAVPLSACSGNSAVSTLSAADETPPSVSVAPSPAAFDLTREELSCGGRPMQIGSYLNDTSDPAAEIGAPPSRKRSPEEIGRKWADSRAIVSNTPAGQSAKPASYIYDNEDPAKAEKVKILVRTQEGDLKGALIAERDKVQGWVVAADISCSSAAVDRELLESEIVRTPGGFPSPAPSRP